MKALSLWQPWASAIVLGHKRIETRSWETSYRGPLAIHAAKRPMGNEERALCRRLFFPEEGHAFGAIVATCDLIACVPIDGPFVHDEMRATLEYQWGNYSPGRFAWYLANVQLMVPPVPARGFQQLWNWEPSK